VLGEEDTGVPWCVPTDEPDAALLLSPATSAPTTSWSAPCGEPAREPGGPRGNRRPRGVLERGLTSGRTGNTSVRLGDDIMVTPTGSSLGRLDPDALSEIDTERKHTRRPSPSKEAFPHAAVYRARPDAGCPSRSSCATSAKWLCCIA